MSVSPGTMMDDFNKPFIKTLSIYDWVFALLCLAGTWYAWNGYSQHMDGYEVGILFGSGLTMIGLGWYWKQSRSYMLAVALISLYAISSYEPAIAALKQAGLSGAQAIAALSDLDNKEQSKFLFKYFGSSTSATMWMSALFVLATVTYFVHLFARNEFAGKVATAMAWVATTMGSVGLMVRWRESYLINPDYGHIPVSNLYEVFILFAIITALIYLFYEMRYKTRALGGFVLLIISAAVAFLLWYQFDKGAHEIQPLVPALQSYWMKIHVPANFIGYGCFGLAAMVGSLSLLMHYYRNPNRMLGIVVPIAIFVVVGGYYLLRQSYNAGEVSQDILLRSLYAGLGLTALLTFIGWATLRPAIQSALPAAELVDDVMYKSIALGFAFFTIATVLGALWAGEAWGGYWSWDPKETWALIVWLNYAAWLHMRLTKGWRGMPMAWWAVIGLFITTFAFLGVNMFLSGLHSYGEL